MRVIYVLISMFLIISCSDDSVLPKPKAHLRLEYPKAIYEPFSYTYFEFEKSKYSKIERVTDKKINLAYPFMKAKIYLTYNEVQQNLEELIRDAEKFTYKHTIKADEILTRNFINEEKSVFATFNMVTGEAASPIQFYATDSIKHFLTGSLYFYAHPNYDSIMPAIKYIQKDIIHLLETLKWKNKQQKNTDD